MKMKRILCFIMLCLILVSAVACNNATVAGGDETKNNTDSSDNTNTTESQDTVADTGAVKEPYNGVFRVGYSRVDITPEGDIPLNNGIIMTNVNDPLYATCVAVNDGKNTALIFTVDVKNFGEGPVETVKTRIKAVTKVPNNYIMICATHNHSAPMPEVPGGDSRIVKWTAKLYNLMVDAAKEAIADLSDAEIYTGVGKTTGMAFVRRYILADGTYSGIWTGNKSTSPIVAYETEADDTVQIIRFKREDKKDVVMANWQAHAADAIGYLPNSITADIVYHVRHVVERKDNDALFAFYAGASGNINLSAKVEGTKKYANYMQVGQALGDVIVKEFDNLTKIEAGKISSRRFDYVATVRKEDATTVANAKAVQAAGAADSPAYNKLMEQYGFASKHHVNAVISRDKAAETDKLTLITLAFGDLAFIAVPYEMFDTNGMEVKEGSPFEMTFVLTNAGGAGGYVPSALAVPHGGYEVYTTKYSFGTAEAVVNELLRMLNDQKK